jgi:hypothetical protein
LFWFWQCGRIGDGCGAGRRCLRRHVGRMARDSPRRRERTDPRVFSRRQGSDRRSPFEPGQSAGRVTFSFKLFYESKNTEDGWMKLGKISVAFFFRESFRVRPRSDLVENFRRFFLRTSSASDCPLRSVEQQSGAILA